MSSLAVGSPDPGFGVGAQSVTLVDLIEARARSQAERVAYTFLGKGEAERITWNDLHRSTRHHAGVSKHSRRSIDVVLAELSVNDLFVELTSESSDRVIAYRGRQAPLISKWRERQLKSTDARAHWRFVTPSFGSARAA